MTQKYARRAIDAPRKMTFPEGRVWTALALLFYSFALIVFIVSHSPLMGAPTPKNSTVDAIGTTSMVRTPNLTKDRVGKSIIEEAENHLVHYLPPSRNSSPSSSPNTTLP